MEHDDEVLDALAASYGGATATQALWQWAGGVSAALAAAPDVDARDRWALHWGQSCGEPRDGVPDPRALLREALLDDPGEDVHLAWLRARAEPGPLERAEALATRLVELAPDGFPAGALSEALLSFPEPRDELSGLCALAPPLQAKLTQDERDGLVRTCAGLAARGKTLAELRGLRDGLRDTADDALAPAIARLKALLHEIEAALPGDDPLPKELGRLVSRLSFRKAPTAKSTVAGLTSLLVALKATRDEGPDPFAVRAAALRTALLVTSPRS